MRKHDSIDLMKLYSSCSWREWNAFLTECYRAHDLGRLSRTRYQLQAGMTDLAKKKLNSDKIILWFIRLQNSIENTMKKIVREKNPNPCDNPLIAGQHLDLKEKKTARDAELELYLKKSGY